MIYVDPARWLYRGKLYGHMMTDGPLEELHEFAAKIGLRRCWFQVKSHPHYDLSASKRAEAIRLGAQPVSSVEMVKKCLFQYKETRG